MRNINYICVTSSIKKILLRKIKLETSNLTFIDTNFINLDHVYKEETY